MAHLIGTEHSPSVWWNVLPGRAFRSLVMSLDSKGIQLLNGNVTHCSSLAEFIYSSNSVAAGNDDDSCCIIHRKVTLSPSTPEHRKGTVHVYIVALLFVIFQTPLTLCVD